MQTIGPPSLLPLEGGPGDDPPPPTRAPVRDPPPDLPPEGGEERRRCGQDSPASSSLDERADRRRFLSSPLKGGRSEGGGRARLPGDGDVGAPSQNFQMRSPCPAPPK